MARTGYGVASYPMHWHVIIRLDGSRQIPIVIYLRTDLWLVLVTRVQAPEGDPDKHDIVGTATPAVAMAQNRQAWHITRRRNTSATTRGTEEARGAHSSQQWHRLPLSCSYAHIVAQGNVCRLHEYLQCLIHGGLHWPFHGMPSWLASYKLHSQKK